MATTWHRNMYYKFRERHYYESELDLNKAVHGGSGYVKQETTAGQEKANIKT